MKNLLDELHELDNDEIKVPSDFSKNVMKKIKKSNRIIALGYVASIASVACVIGITVFFVNKNGLFDKVFSKGANESVTAMSLNETPNQKDIEESKTEDYTEAQGVVTNSINEDAVAPKSVNDRVGATYSKQLNKEEYLKEINNKLIINGYDISRSDDEIIVYSKDFNEVYELLEEYIDVELSLSGDRIIIQLAK